LSWRLSLTVPKCRPDIPRFSRSLFHNGQPARRDAADPFNILASAYLCTTAFTKLIKVKLGIVANIKTIFCYHLLPVLYGVLVSAVFCGTFLALKEF